MIETFLEKEVKLSKQNEKRELLILGALLTKYGSLNKEQLDDLTRIAISYYNEGFYGGLYTGMASGLVHTLVYQEILDSKKNECCFPKEIIEIISKFDKFYKINKE